MGEPSMLRSYVSGGWHTATDGGRPLHDAVTGAEITRISSTGVDFAGALEFGRRVGGPALRELTFHQRAALLKELGLYLRERRDELYAVSDYVWFKLAAQRLSLCGQRVPSSLSRVYPGFGTFVITSIRVPSGSV